MNQNNETSAHTGKSNFNTVFDNINNQDFGNIIKALGGNKNTTVFLMSDSIVPVLSARIKPPFVYVAAGADAARRAAKILANCGLSVAAASCAPDMPIKTDMPVLRDTELYTSADKIINGQADVLVISAGAITACVPDIKTESSRFTVNGKYKVKDFAEKLLSFGYTKVPTVSAAGEFSVRGDVVDFWPSSEDNPVRMMFFGDTVEAIKKIDIQTYLSCGTLTEYRLNPLLTDRYSLPKRTEFHPITDALRGIVKYFVFERPREISDIIKQSEKQNIMRLTSLIEGGLLLPEHTKMFCSASDLNFDKYTCFGFQNLNTNHSLFKTEQVFTLNTAAVPNYYNALSALTEDIVRNARTKKVFVYTGKSKALENYFREKGIVPNNITVIQKELGASFELSDCKIAVYSIEPPPEFTKESVFEKAKSKFTLPRIGEVVVHEHHGLGRFLGIKKLSLMDAERDYIVLQYDGGALVYLPPEQTGLLGNYSGEPSRLSRIGGQDFAQAKQRVKRRLKELSFKLSELYSRRARVKSNVYNCDEVTMQQFSSSFEYILTQDQQKAIDDIERDMAGPRVMDRLICGDVGYGKTEVALTAVFRAICSGFQAAMLCPTTILSVQHYNTACSRLNRFGIRTEVLNRFRTPAEVKAILDELSSGNIDFIIGTHSLLSPQIKYKNLGLLVLDEEQRFGVGHKEKIKQIKSSIDVLTLSATPIPRTLNMALIGIRDISVISSPPVNRFPVITYVCEYSDYLMTDAIEREYARGGQTIVLYNDVSGIDKFAARLQSLAGKIKVGIIHGQMSESRLESTITALYNKEIDVMVASTIIENGVDLTSANTLLVVDADRLGVAQMHQLRGRVGRADIQAYAYFTYRGGKALTEVAASRLEAIRSFYSSGAGMQIAMKDLHLRGAGSILGANQSGHLEQIGFDTYCKILEEVANENRNFDTDSFDRNGQGSAAAETPQSETVLDIALNCFIPHTYIENEEERMKIYVAVSQIKNESDAAQVLNNLEDIYGKAPQEVKNIVTIGYIRALCKNKGIRLVTFNKNSRAVKFFDGKARRINTPSISGLIDCLKHIENIKPV